MIQNQRLVVITALCLMLSACDAFQAVLAPPVVITWSAPCLNGGVLDERRGRFPVPLSAWVTFSGALLVYSCQARKRVGRQNALSAPAGHHLVQFPGSDWLAQIIVHSGL